MHCTQRQRLLHMRKIDKMDDYCIWYQSWTDKEAFFNKYYTCYYEKIISKCHKTKFPTIDIIVYMYIYYNKI